MYLPLRWLPLLSPLLTTVYAAVEAVEVDLVFPRNETYSPSFDFPVVFAVQNPQRAELLNLYISYEVRWGDFLNNYTVRWHDLYWANYSSADPYFATSHFNLNTTDQWKLTWELLWDSCDEKALTNTDREGGFSGARWRRGYQYFTTDDSPPKAVDLVAATANATCPNNVNAVVINVTDTTRQLSPDASARERDICVGTVNSTDSATATTRDPCRVAVDEKTAASMAADRLEFRCDSGTIAPEECPSENGASQRAMLAASFFWAAFGMLGYALV